MLEADVEVDRRDFTVAVALLVRPGERLALFGASGSGKTTTLEAIAGLAPLRRGRVVLAGRVLAQTSPPRRDVPPWQRRVGLLRQDPGIFPHLTVRQNLSYGMGRQPDPAQIARIAAELGIAGMLEERPARLSGGQAHRVALGRLLLARCGALLLDEPYTGLDAGLRRSLTDLVRAVVAEREAPAVLVAHELAEAQAFADVLAVIDRGRVLQVAAPAQVVARPASRRVAELVGYRGFVRLGAGPGGVAAGAAAGGGAGADGAGDGADGPGVLVGVHPERVVLGAQPDRGPVLAGRVQAAHPAGAGWDAQLVVGGETIWCHLPDRPPAAGEAVEATVLDPPRYRPDGQLLAESARVRS